MGYDRPFSTDKEQTELYAYNPTTRSNINFDFTPTGRYARFNQKNIEQLTTSATESMKAELAKEYGQGRIQVEFSPTEPVSLKGVQYAAKKNGTYTARGVKREQGWIYGFTEPYQIFIIYTIIEREGTNDRQDLKKILDSFEFITKK
jgi:murein tripeptide amidase MpaA